MIHCELNPKENKIEVFDPQRRNIAVVVEENDDPQIWFRWQFERKLSFNDIAIIQDNWNQLQELRKNLQKCPDCGLDKSTCPC